MKGRIEERKEGRREGEREKEGRMEGWRKNEGKEGGNEKRERWKEGRKEEKRKEEIKGGKDGRKMEKRKEKRKEGRVPSYKSVTRTPPRVPGINLSQVSRRQIRCANSLIGRRGEPRGTRKTRGSGPKAGKSSRGLVFLTVPFRAEISRLYGCCIS